jgi:hypothetical protein
VEAVPLVLGFQSRFEAGGILQSNEVGEQQIAAHNALTEQRADEKRTYV